MRLEQAPPRVLQSFNGGSTDQGHHIDTLDIVDNNNVSRQDKLRTTGSATSNTVAANKNVLWDLQPPHSPDEEDEFEEDGRGSRDGNSVGMSENSEEEGRSSSCSEASELAHLASSSEDEHFADQIPNRATDIAEAIAPLEQNGLAEEIAPRTPEPQTAAGDENEDSGKASVNNNSMTDLMLGAFDVFTMETALPKIDLAQLESHLLAAAKREDHRRRNDREEIRRRLAMGEEAQERPGGRKPSLQRRLQSGMDLQLCFMNESANDLEADQEVAAANASTSKPVAVPAIKLSKSATLDPQLMQREAQMALAQASKLARMEMALERQNMRLSLTPSPTSQLLKKSLKKVGVNFPPERRRVSRQLLTDLNVTQLQVLVNDLHTLIEGLNEDLVQMLMERDDLHMEQDSRLVDIEDLNRYLGAKTMPVPPGLQR
ncbi:schwannomin-interacting protein 1 [Neocloeon triangulifer]|uniref:schwannomin-interacting protein 1 n=1 Tax=Neocloeon triangulifer TaxID=2078957 RepID=UPI00286EBF48|nr:schwannomin-interacting protein 1 [Neocloeon triangulifer]